MLEQFNTKFSSSAIIDLQKKLIKQYDLTHDSVDYSDLEEANILPGSVRIRPDRPRERQLEKQTPTRVGLWVLEWATSQQVDIT